MTLLADLLRARGEPIDLPCGGRGKCLKCRVRASGDIAPPDARERALLSDADMREGIRYACMAAVTGPNVTVSQVETVPRRDEIVTRGELPPHTLAPWGDGIGLAVDIGTTTVAAYLYDLSTGAALGEAAVKNPQGALGADVTTRIDRALGGDLPALRDSVRGCVSSLCGVLCARAGVPAAAVQSAVVCGNTAMLYFLTGRDPTSIAYAPFDADCRFGMFVPGDAVGLPTCAKAYLPPCAGAYVGADMTAAMLTAGFDARNGTPRLLVDIGTNGEMALAADGALLCCSTAAGPAFEGAGISCGMTARDGAIHRAWVTDGRVAVDVLGGCEAAGICGSGLVDAVAAMLTVEAIDETGRLTGADPFPLGGAASLTGRDIRAVQLAKSALCAGMRTLLHAANVNEKDVSALLIAGGFGSRIDPTNAARIGLIPPALLPRARAIGNAAGMGASLALLSDERRRAAEALCARATVMDLATDPFFQRMFVEEMMFEGE